MPQAGTVATLDFVTPDRTGNTVKNRSTAAMLSFPKFSLGFMKVLVSFLQVVSVLDRE